MSPGLQYFHSSKENGNLLTDSVMRKAAVYCFDNQGKKMKINLNKLNTDGFFRSQNIGCSYIFHEN